MPKKKEDFKFEVVDGGEMSKEQYDAVVEMLATWIMRDLERKQEQMTDSVEGNSHYPNSAHGKGPV